MLAGRGLKPYSAPMKVHLTLETAKKLNDLAAASGRSPEDIVEDALAGYLEAVGSIRRSLDSDGGFRAGGRDACQLSANDDRDGRCLVRAQSDRMRRTVRRRTDSGTQGDSCATSHQSCESERQPREWW